MEEDGMSTGGAGDQEPMQHLIERLRPPNHSTHSVHHSEIQTDQEGLGAGPPLLESTSIENSNTECPGHVDPFSDSGIRYDEVPSSDLSPSWNEGFGLTQEETNQLLASLQESVPDVGRLFDGSIGTFGWT